LIINSWREILSYDLPSQSTISSHNLPPSQNQQKKDDETEKNEMVVDNEMVDCERRRDDDDMKKFERWQMRMFSLSLLVNCLSSHNLPSSPSHNLPSSHSSSLESWIDFIIKSNTKRGLKCLLNESHLIPPSHNQPSHDQPSHNQPSHDQKKKKRKKRKKDDMVVVDKFIDSCLSTIISHKFSSHLLSHDLPSSHNLPSSLNHLPSHFICLMVGEEDKISSHQTVKNLKNKIDEMVNNEMIKYFHLDNMVDDKTIRRNMNNNKMIKSSFSSLISFPFSGHLLPFENSNSIKWRNELIKFLKK